MSDTVEHAVAEAYRREWGRVVAALIGATGDWDLAEECAQDAFVRALETWPRAGVPDRPGAWLTTTARNRALDRLRRGAVGAAKLEQVATLGRGVEPQLASPAADDSGIRDDRLRLIFTCCHPALGFDAQVALALRTVVGLTTAEIARAMLVPEATMAKRLVRAKHKVRVAGIPYRVPPARVLPERTAAVLGVVYLLFNEGYAATAGEELARRRLCDEAIHLAGAIAELMPDEPEAGALHALLLLHDARREARVDDAGGLVPLQEQDRSRWDAAQIDAGLVALRRAMRSGRLGPYQVQAAIAACHVTAATAADTDWAQIVELYDLLVSLVPSPVVALNRAVAVAMASSPEAGMHLLDDLTSAGDLDDYHLLTATRADLLRRTGRPAEAAAAYRQVLAMTGNEAERRYLRRRIKECAGPV